MDKVEGGGLCLCKRDRSPPLEECLLVTGIICEYVCSRGPGTIDDDELLLDLKGPSQRS